MRKKIIKIGSIISAIVMGLALIILPFSGEKFNPNTLICSADEVTQSYSYVGSNLFTFNAFMNNGQPNGWFTVAIRCSFYSNYQSPDLTEVDVDFYWWNTNNNNFDTSYKMFNNVRGGSATLGLSANSHSFVRFGANESSVYDYNQFFPADVIKSGAFNGNVQRIRIYSADTMTNMSVSWTGWKSFRLEYIDDANNSIRFEFLMPASVSIDDRIYYVNVDFPDNYKVGYDSGYAIGYDKGLLDNQSNIYSSGYSAGQTVGYNNGYNAGVASASDYSFLSLIGAVVDVPVQTFMGLFNFELLGINLAGFFTGLLTLAFIITVVKLLL